MRPAGVSPPLRTWTRLELATAGGWLLLAAALAVVPHPPRFALLAAGGAGVVLAASWAARVARRGGPGWSRLVVPAVLVVGTPAALLADVPSLARMRAVEALGLADVRGNTATQPVPGNRGRPKLPPGATVAFLGDSLTNRWGAAGQATWHELLAPLGAGNLGVGEERVEHILWRVRHGDLDGPPLRAVVILAGTNNLGRNTPAQTAEGVTALVAEVRTRQPGAAVVLVGLLPRAHSPSAPARAWVGAVNRQLERLADGSAVRYVDATSALLEPDGTLTVGVAGDGLHLSADGYRRLGPVIAAALPERVDLP